MDDFCAGPVIRQCVRDLILLLTKCSGSHFMPRKQHVDTAGACWLRGAGCPPKQSKTFGTVKVDLLGRMFREEKMKWNHGTNLSALKVL